MYRLFFGIDFYQEVEILHSKIEKFFGKVLVVRKKAVPLHPLSPKKLGLRHEERVL